MGLDDAFPIRQAIPVWLARARFCSWARWAGIFIEKNVFLVIGGRKGGNGGGGHIFWW